MNLTPREKDKLLVSMAAIVARRRLERGQRPAGDGGQPVRGGLDPGPSLHQGGGVGVLRVVVQGDLDVEFHDQGLDRAEGIFRRLADEIRRLRRLPRFGRPQRHPVDR